MAKFNNVAKPQQIPFRRIYG